MKFYAAFKNSIIWRCNCRINEVVCINFSVRDLIWRTFESQSVHVLYQDDIDKFTIVFYDSGMGGGGEGEGFGGFRLWGLQLPSFMDLVSLSYCFYADVDKIIKWRLTANLKSKKKVFKLMCNNITHLALPKTQVPLGRDCFMKYSQSIFQSL